MRDDSRLRGHQGGAIGGFVTICFGILLTFSAVIMADEGADNATKMLDNLKRQSAEERWQRIKRLHPTDLGTSRGNPLTKAVETSAGQGSEDPIPPSPEQTLSVPTLMELPIDISNDWVLPARPLPMDDELVPIPNAPHLSGAVPIPRPAPAAPRIAFQDTSGTQSTNDGTTPDAPRNLRDRKISDIMPFYDRERDSDMREFAIEKGKEFGIHFVPRNAVERSFPQVTFTWEASNFWYRPLYFADPSLERYGHTYPPLIQPFVSIARFTTQAAFLPYQLTIAPPLSQTGPLGWYRPGDCTPKLCYQVPLNLEAAAVQVGAVTGVWFLIP